MYKVYVKVNGVYRGPDIFKDLETAKQHAKGECLIIKRENNTDELIEYKEKEYDDDWER